MKPVRHQRVTETLVAKNISPFRRRGAGGNGESRQVNLQCWQLEIENFSRRGCGGDLIRSKNKTK